MYRLVSQYYLHGIQVRVLREHLKRSLNNSQKYQKQLNEYRQELLALRDQKKQLESIASKKDLLGREKLTHQLQLATNLLKDKEEIIVVSNQQKFVAWCMG